MSQQDSSNEESQHMHVCYMYHLQMSKIIRASDKRGYLG